MKRIMIWMALALVIQVNGQTTIADKTEVFGTWSRKGSPYLVMGEAIVPEGKTLTIKPGVVVKFRTGDVHDYIEDGFKCGFLRVNGTLVAKGKAGKMIRFTRESSSGYWGNVYINSRAQGNIVEYCRFEYAYYVRTIIPDDNATGALTFNNATGQVNNCLFMYNGWTAINCKNDAFPKITNCTLVANEYGIECNSSSFPTIINTIIWNNENGAYINGEAEPRIMFSLYQDDELPDGFEDKGNNLLGMDPRLTPELRLSEGSPCLKAGMKGMDMGVEF
ncbi:MAG: hypothetical protein JW861_03560 [Bacteroidales bacterium]|nr:hypothetical protein [Bacteroidales bacterium]